MFGRVRAAPSSVDSLERPPPKILKDHSLSVYENTLVKLKLGSKLQLHSGSDQSEAENDDRHVEDEDCTTDDGLGDSFKAKLPVKRNASLISLFSKYHRRSHEFLASCCDCKDHTCPQQQSFQSHV